MLTPVGHAQRRTVDSTNTVSLAEEKIRAREQWTQDPCGAEYAREHELGTREFLTPSNATGIPSTHRGCPN